MRFILALLASACGGKAVVDGAGTRDCRELREVYATTLERARACDGTNDESVCIELVADSPGDCGCPTFVNAENLDELGELAELTAAYAAQACDAGLIDCGVVGCDTPPSASCAVSETGGGTCLDMR